MQIGQRLAIIEPGRVRDETFDQLQHAAGAIDEAAQHLVAIDAAALAPFIEPGFGARGVFRRRQPAQRQKIRALEMRLLLLELCPAFGIDQRRDGIGEAAVGIAVGGVALRLDEDRPARAQTVATRC